MKRQQQTVFAAYENWYIRTNRAEKAFDRRLLYRGFINNRGDNCPETYVSWKKLKVWKNRRPIYTIYNYDLMAFSNNFSYIWRWICTHTPWLYDANYSNMMIIEYFLNHQIYYAELNFNNVFLMDAVDNIDHHHQILATMNLWHRRDRRQ